MSHHPSSARNPNRVSIMSKNEHGEYCVRVYRDGKHYEPADYFTDDRADAFATRDAMRLSETERHERIRAQQKQRNRDASGMNVTQSGLTLVGREIVRIGMELHRNGGCDQKQVWPELLARLERIAATEPNDNRAPFRYAVATLRGALRADGSRLLKNPRRDSTDAVRCFIRANNWHRGDTGGSLYGPIGDAMLYPDSYRSADTLAIVVRVALGWRMLSAERWQKAIHG